MQKLIIGGVIVIAILTMVFTMANPFSHKKINAEDGIINLQLYESYTVNASGVREYFTLLEDVPLIGFFQIRNSEDLYELAETLDLELPDGFDFDNYQDKYLAITFGRQLVEIQYECRENYYGRDSIFAEITFTEEHYDQTMYFYITDKISLWPADLGGYNTFYVMNGSEKVYIGDVLMNFNKQSPNFIEGK